MRIGPSAMLFVFACVLAACETVHHLERNAPGGADIQARPPRSLEYPRVLRPEDPGERIVNVAVGPHYTIGGHYPDRGLSPRGVQSLGFEVGATYHARDSALLTPITFLALPRYVFDAEMKYGVHLGWSPFQWGRASDGLGVGPAYLEGVVRFPIPLVALGYRYDPGTGTHGPQLTVSPLGVNRLRFSYHVDGSFRLSWVVTFKRVDSIVWSR